MTQPRDATGKFLPTTEPMSKYTLYLPESTLEYVKSLPNRRGAQWVREVLEQAIAAKDFNKSSGSR